MSQDPRARYCVPCKNRRENLVRRLREDRRVAERMWQLAAELADAACRMLERSPGWSTVPHETVWRPDTVIHQLMSRYHLWRAFLRLADDAPVVCPAESCPQDGVPVPRRGRIRLTPEPEEATMD